MRVLIVGGGGREHALAWCLAGSPLLRALFIAPGNPGTAAHGTNVAIGATDVPALVAFAEAEAIDLVVPGPEASLAAGLADAMGMAGIACCGPSAAAARIETSKSFAKEICDAAGIPTALWERFEDPASAREFVRRRGAPIVVKADGLAAGKGVVVAASVAEAEQAIAAFMQADRVGPAGRAVVIEEVLGGREVSLFALCDGQHAIPLGAARDYKRARDGDEGPNTGGMGAVSPPPGWSPALEQAAMAQIIGPALAELSRRGTPFRGILFAGLMLTEQGAKVIEFNARLGDPETQCLLPRLASDLLPALQAACDGELRSFALRWRQAASVAVVLTAQGYPAQIGEGEILPPLQQATAMPDITLFQSGTVLRDDTLATAGGRVLTVVGHGQTVADARARAYAGVQAIGWTNGHWRHDIGA